ncbi:MAG: class I SAM-dependent methyltransferase [Thiobacillus sp.]|nr:class I SAM-dependent methyltransferase [Gammaproteobacteria bacterium]MBU4498659.1 class I SAM-dependent methyltransferase [Gammaproteobacteria bacterium]MDO9009292.1 class I SAM-dependent methyltransferase [Thiobacillus sp.]MDP1924281.1 class I SAM-dependent methyltransferase [Thiobacillus sp.]MDP3126157.1 class I SAM-dependent methyltransferase [Thiobacillus sp.]
MKNDPDSHPIHAPHPPLTAYYADENERRGYVGKLFDHTAADYDRIDRLLALGSGPWYRNQALQRAGLKPGMRVVDVGIGTGLVAREAVKLVGDPALVIGVDPSVGMMAEAHLPGVQLIEGRAEAIPFPDASFDFLSMGYALRHIGDLSAAFSEFHRVLKPGGRLCLLEITKPERAWSQALLKAYMRGVVPVLARLIGSSAESAKLWRYYWDTIEACVPPSGVIDTLEKAGFTGVNRHIESRALSILAEYQATKPG